MLIIQESGEDKAVKNISVSTINLSDRNIKWNSPKYDGFIVVISDAIENGEDQFWEMAESARSISELRKDVKSYQSILLPYDMYTAAGSMHCYKQFVVRPQKISVYPYETVKNNTVLYKCGNYTGNTVFIPIVINYTMTTKRGLFGFGSEKKEIRFPAAKCDTGVLIYKVSGCSVSFPITAEMMRDSFSLSTNGQNITVCVEQRYSEFYKVQQK